LLVGLVLLQNWETQSSGWAAELLSQHRVAMGTVVLGICVGIPLAILRGAMPRASSSESTELEIRFWKGIVALVPMVVAGYAGYEIGFVPELVNLEAVIVYQSMDGSVPAVSLSFLTLFRIILLGIGFMITTGVLWKQYREETKDKSREGSLRSLLVRAAFSTMYGAAILVLMGGRVWTLD